MNSQISNTSKNPFIIGAPADTPEAFIDREEALRIIIGRLNNCHDRGGCIVTGEPGTGKTSLLNFLFNLLAKQQSDPQTDQPPYLEPNITRFIMLRTPLTEEAIWYEILSEINEWLPKLKDEITTLMALCEQNSEQEFDFKIRKFFRKLGRAENKLVVVIIDDFDWFLEMIGIDKQALYCFRKILRKLLDLPAPRGFSLIITSNKNPQEHMPDFDISFCRSMPVIPLRPFEEDEAKELFDKYLCETAIEFTQSERDDIVKEAKYIPGRIQEEAWKLFDKKLLSLKKQNTPVQGGNEMLTPTEQLGIGILLEATKFLFAELGRRLAFWRDKKGEEETPQKIEIIEKQNNAFLKLDDVEKRIITLKVNQIESSLKILKNNLVTFNTYREELTNPIISPDRKAFLNQKISELEKEINQEGERLQRLIEQSLE